MVQGTPVLWGLSKGQKRPTEKCKKKKKWTEIVVGSLTVQKKRKEKEKMIWEKKMKNKRKEKK